MQVVGTIDMSETLFGFAYKGTEVTSIKLPDIYLENHPFSKGAKKLLITIQEIPIPERNREKQ
jgi:hypothetical protein